MESRSAAKLCATVLVTRECLLLPLTASCGVAEEEEEGTYDWVGAAGAEPLGLVVDDGSEFSISRRMGVVFSKGKRWAESFYVYNKPKTPGRVRSGGQP